MITALEALERLKEGNRHCIAGFNENGVIQLDTLRQELLKGQEPFAVILGCSDSRAPVELIFDQGLGDLFVVRVAGNIVSPPQIGSVEFAVDKFGTRLVVVMGHSMCGAVDAAYQLALSGDDAPSPHLYSIVNSIRPAVEPLLRTELKDDPDALIREAIRNNVRLSVEALRTASDVLKPLLDTGELLIVGAVYDLKTGEVDFFDGTPGDS